MYVGSLKKKDNQLMLNLQEIPGTRKDGQSGMYSKRVVIHVRKLMLPSYRCIHKLYVNQETASMRAPNEKASYKQR